MQSPYGSWKSPITSDLIVAATIGLSSPAIYRDALYWVESRPQEAGRNVLVERDTAGQERDINAAPYNIRTRVHEYGGGAWLLFEDTLYFANFADQQLYRQPLDSNQPTALTDEPTLRFANLIADHHHRRLICVVEDHSSLEPNKSPEPQNRLCAVDLDSGKVTTLTEGHDFYAAPTLSPDGRSLAFISWDHPDMPWDETTLWLADMGPDGQIGTPGYIAGGNKAGQKISVQQPQFSPSGELFYISDQSGWWNIYQCNPAGKANILCEMAAEFGVPLWGFAPCTYKFLDDQRLIAVFSIDNESHIGRISLGDGTMEEMVTPYTHIGSIDLANNQLVFTGASATIFSGIVLLDLASSSITPVKQVSDLTFDNEYFSIPETISFPTPWESAGPDTATVTGPSNAAEVAHGFFYAPKNKDYQPVPGELPPLIVMLHGGPTGATHNGLSLHTQFWTSRGFAVLDVNYRGSTGYGRVYRDKLLHNWGIVDVQDTVAGSRYLVEQHRVDGQRLAIRGGSAGGYTTLSALTFTDTFSAGASHYGIGDLEALARDTHKFESRYLDSMIGPYPERLDIYQARSPIHHVDQLSSPCIFFQGLEDRIVPPNQAEAMVTALNNKGIPVAYVPFEGEQHGFRAAGNIKRCMDLELYFYARIFAFSLADQIEPIEILNLPP